MSDAYAEGARRAGHDVALLDVGRIDFPLLRSKKEWEEGNVPREIATARRAVEDADHLVFFFPLWLGGMPALLKGFLEQIMRPGIGLRLRALKRSILGFMGIAPVKDLLVGSVEDLDQRRRDRWLTTLRGLGHRAG